MKTKQTKFIVVILIAQIGCSSGLNEDKNEECTLNKYKPEIENVNEQSSSKIDVDINNIKCNKNSIGIEMTIYSTNNLNVNVIDIKYFIDLQNSQTGESSQYFGDVKEKYLPVNLNSSNSYRSSVVITHAFIEDPVTGNKDKINNKNNNKLQLILLLFSSSNNEPIKITKSINF